MKLTKIFTALLISIPCAFSSESDILLNDDQQSDAREVRSILRDRLNNLDEGTYLFYAQRQCNISASRNNELTRIEIELLWLQELINLVEARLENDRLSNEDELFFQFDN